MSYQGTGIYTLPEAARLINVQSRDLRRWLFGYEHTRKVAGDRVRAFSKPLWETQLAGEDFDDRVIGFRDLLEVHFVGEFRRQGVHLLVIRRCLEHAREILQTDYPFSSCRFRTDGKTIFAQALRDVASEEEGDMIDLRNQQFVIKDVIRPSLYAGIDYANDEQHPARWFPCGKRLPVVLDPQHQFGRPIVVGNNVPTDTLYASYLAEGGTSEAARRTSRIYDVPLKSVEAAVSFEESLKRPVH